MRKTILIKLIIICCFFLLPETGHAQVFEFLKGQKSVSIPFEYKYNFILIEVKLQNVLPLTLMFDTGAEHTILFDKVHADIFGIKYSNRIRVYGSDLSKELYANVARNVKIELEGIANIPRDIVVLDEDYFHLKEITGINIDGILSNSFFNNMVVKIDYKRQMLTVTDPREFKVPNKFSVMDIDYHKRKPYINSEIVLGNGDVIELSLLIDSGAALPLLLHANTNKNIEIPENVINGKLGVGLGGEIEGFMGRIKQMKFYEYEFKEIVSSFQDLSESKLSQMQIVRNGLIGNQILSRFNIILDPIREKMYVKPNRKKLTKPFKYDKSGLVIYAFGDHLNDFVIQNVHEGSPADEAGFKAGDLIKRVGIVSAKSMNLVNLLSKFQKKAGKKLKIKILRDGEKINKTLILRDLI